MSRALLARMTVCVALIAWSLGAFVGGQDSDFPGNAEPTPELPTRSADVHLRARQVGLHDPVRILGGDLPVLACVAYHVLDGDRIVAFPIGGEGFHEGLAVTREATQVLDLVGEVNEHGQPQLFFTEVTRERSTLMTSWFEDGEFLAPRAVQGVGHPASAADCHRMADGSLWIAWQECRRDPDAERGSYDIRMGRVSADHLASTIDVTGGPFNDRDPVLASSADGTLWLAYTRTDRLDSEIVVRAIETGTGNVGEVIVVSDDPSADDFHAALAADANGVWVAWDRLRDPRRGASDKDISNIEVSMPLAHVGPDGVTLVESPTGPAPTIRTSAPITRSGGQPSIELDSTGRLHVVYRTLRSGPEITFPVVHQTFDGTWSSPMAFADSGGNPTAVCFRQWNDQLWVDYQQFEFSQETTELELPWQVRRVMRPQLIERGNGLIATRADLLGAASIGVTGEPVQLARVARPERSPEPRSHPLGDVHADPFLSGRDHHRIVVDDREYRVYWGDLHRHSNMSHCTNGNEPDPRLNYDFGLDFHGYDFLALTDHTNHMVPHQWWTQGKLLDLYRTADFVPLQGYEWAHPTAGHQNVILRDRSDRIAGKPVRTARQLWDLLQRDAALTIPHHTAHRDMPFDWEQNDPHFLRLVEVFQACRGNYEFQGCFRGGRSATATGSFVQDGLQQGQRLGIIASSDHGNGTSYTAVLAESLDRDALFEALSARRVYGSTTKGILVDFRVNDRVMGRELRTDQPPRVDVRVVGTQELAEVVVYRNGEIWQSVGRGDTWQDREQVIPLQITAGRRFVAEADLDIRVGVDAGNFVLDRNDAGRDGPHWRTADRRRSAVWRCPAGTGAFDAETGRILLHASPRATVTLQTGDQQRELKVADLLTEPLRLSGRGATAVRLSALGSDDFKVDPSQGLGTREFEHTWIDDEPAPQSWYYVRVIQTDSEIAWSSPVFVRHDGP